MFKNGRYLLAIGFATIAFNIITSELGNTISITLLIVAGIAILLGLFLRIAYIFSKDE